MVKQNINIIFSVFLLVSIAELLVAFEVFNLANENIVKYLAIFYVVIAIIAMVLIRRIAIIAEKNKPKEEVKIIYKNFDKEKADKELIDKKTTDKAQKISGAFIKDIQNEDGVEKFTEKVLSKLAKTFNIVQGVFYLWNDKNQTFYSANTFAFYSTTEIKDFEIGEGIAGQVAKNQKFLLIDNVPQGYIKIASGLGEGSPKFLAFVPLVHNSKTIAILEFASFVEFPEPTDKIFTTLAEKLVPLVQKYV